jgi:hypothetical protein
MLLLILALFARWRRTLSVVAGLLLLVSARRLIVPAVDEKRARHDAFVTVDCTGIITSYRIAGPATAWRV